MSDWSAALGVEPGPALRSRAVLAVTPAALLGTWSDMIVMSHIVWPVRENSRVNLGISWAKFGKRS